MPRYFFHVQDGAFDPDDEGTEYPDLATAKVEAVRLAGEFMRDNAAAIWADGQLIVTIQNAEGLTLAVVTVGTHLAPAATLSPQSLLESSTPQEH